MVSLLELQLTGRRERLLSESCLSFTEAVEAED